MTDEKFTVLGLDDESGNVELHRADSAAECGQWVTGYTKDGYGGYSGLAVIDPNGDWICVFEPHPFLPF